ncbi:MAG TPA: hypothetical protein VGJ62_07800 [Gemmatimonadaceae bacterium]
MQGVGVILHDLRSPYALVVAFLLVAPGITAQNVDSLRASYILPLPSAVEVAGGLNRISPGSSSGTPTAYGAEFGDVFLGAGYQARTRYTSHPDGAVVGGFGLGNPRTFLGFEAAITSLSTVRSGFFRRSSFSFKVHRALSGNLAIAYGWEDAIITGGTDAGSSMYGVLSSYIRTRQTYGSPFSSITLSAGVGGGRFQTEKAFDEGEHGVNAFGSVGVRVLSPVSLFADWTGQDLSLGASIVPFVRLPLFITPAFADMTGSAGDGARFVLGVGLDFSLLSR